MTNLPLSNPWMRESGRATPKDAKTSLRRSRIDCSGMKRISNNKNRNKSPCSGSAGEMTSSITSLRGKQVGLLTKTRGKEQL